MNNCKLKNMFDLRNSFIEQMQDVHKGSYPSLPVNLSEKASQQFCRDLALRGVEEMFEALQHLKNWKPHRVTEVTETIDKEEFLEEIVDAFNYFFSLLITVGFDEKDLHEAYLRKDTIIRERLRNGY